MILVSSRNTRILKRLETEYLQALLDFAKVIAEMEIYICVGLTEKVREHRSASPAGLPPWNGRKWRFPDSVQGGKSAVFMMYKLHRIWLCEGQSGCQKDKVRRRAIFLGSLPHARQQMKRKHHRAEYIASNCRLVPFLVEDMIASSDGCILDNAIDPIKLGKAAIGKGPHHMEVGRIQLPDAGDSLDSRGRLDVGLRFIASGQGTHGKDDAGCSKAHEVACGISTDALIGPCDDESLALDFIFVQEYRQVFALRTEKLARFHRHSRRRCWAHNHV
jgi:hypothetical protein